MKIYLVGGAVRDQLLGLPVKERDWVVVGATPEALLKQGFQPVGKDFPVFLHPDTHEEYALARTERKVAKGYKGFTFHSTPDVTLEEDLKRRDLTVNAIAQNDDGTLIDPHHGQEDLKKKVLKHISDAFAEDPVRILRVARFAAKLPAFTVHSDTNQLMGNMVDNGEVDALVPERVWQELSRALTQPAPERFFEVLTNCNAIHKILPGITLDKKSFIALQKACELTDAAPMRLAALCHNQTTTAVEKLCKRLRAPREFSELAVLTTKHHEAVTTLHAASPEAILSVVKSIDAARRPERFESLLIVFKACDINATLLEKITQAVLSVDTAALQNQNLQGQDFAQALRALQYDAIKNCCS